MLKIGDKAVQEEFYRGGHGSPLPVDSHIAVKDLHETFLLGGAEILIVLPLFRTDDEIHDGPVGFDQVVHQIERVPFGSVKDAEHGKKSLRGNRPGQCAPNNGVSVIEKGIGLVLPSPGKVFPEKGRKIESGRRSFEIVGIPGFDDGGHFPDPVSPVFPKKIEAFRLILDFPADDLPPESSSLRFRDPELPVGDSCLTEMSGIGNEHPVGKMRPPADVEGNPVLRQFAQECGREKNLRRVQNQTLRIFERKRGLSLLRLDPNLTIFDMNPCRTSDENGSPAHGAFLL